MSEKGDRIDKYVIEHQLGHGGMGVVYKARDIEKNMDVAIKTIPPDLAHHREFLRRFQQEARALMRLHHPNIVSLIDLIEDQANHYMVLEYVDGPSLSQLLTKGPLPPERAREIASQVCDALTHAHEHNIVHRDIKPSNILLTKEGQVKVTDFGIARVLDATLGTLTGKVFGTARYASPEQIKGLKVDARSDLYALGVVLYEMLTGRPPFLGTDDEVMEQHVRAKPVPPRQWREEIPAALESVVLRCLEKDRESRYQTAQELAADLRRGQLAKEATVIQKELEEDRRRRRPIGVFAAIALVLLIGLATLAVVVRPRPWGGGGDTTISVVGTSTPAHETPLTRAVTKGSAVASETAPPLATRAEAPVAPTPTPFVGKIAFLSDRDHQDLEPVNGLRPLELYTMSPDGSDQTRLTFGDTPLSEVGASGGYPWVQRVSWQPAEENIIVLLSAATDMAAFFRPSDGQLERTIDLGLNAGGQSIYGTSMDWSPDGKRIAYAVWPPGELNASLWVANSDGTEQCQIVENVSSYRPVWSPDGEWIAFSSGAPIDTSGLYVVRPDGTGLRHITGGHRIGWIAWSPDGTQIAYEYWDPYDIVTVSVATGQGTNLTAPLHLTASHPTWSPDGSQIAFQERRTVDEIWIMNADGSDAHKIADGRCPAWQPPPGIAAPEAAETVVSQTQTGVAALPAGGRIAFVSDRDGNSEIYAMNADGTGQTRLTENPARDDSPSWSPDGRRIAFTSDRDGNEEIYVMNADGTDQANLTQNTANDWYPCWSPDGGFIAFVSLRDGNDEIYIVSADGKGVTRLTNDSPSEITPSWSPDGTRVAFQSKRDANWEIYVMNVDGTAQTRLTENLASDHLPSWSPDGRRIAFTSGRDGNSEIYVMNADGTRQTRLTENLASDSWSSWSPDGRRIAFTSGRDGNSDIYVMNADGSGVRRLTNNPAMDWWPAWSPG